MHFQRIWCERRIDIAEVRRRMRLPVRSQINNRMTASTPLLSNESGILKASVGKLQGLDRDENIEIILISKRRIRAVVRNQSKALQHSVLNPGFSKHMINKPEFFHHDFQALAVHRQAIFQNRSDVLRHHSQYSVRFHSLPEIKSDAACMKPAE